MLGSIEVCPTHILMSAYPCKGNEIPMLKYQDMLMYGGRATLLKDYILLLLPKTFSDYSPWVSSIKHQVK